MAASTTGEKVKVKRPVPTLQSQDAVVAELNGLLQAVDTEIQTLTVHDLNLSTTLREHQKLTPDVEKEGYLSVEQIDIATEVLRVGVAALRRKIKAIQTIYEAHPYLTTDISLLDKVKDQVNGMAKRNTVYIKAVSYTHLRAHETPEHLVCRLLL